MLQIRFGAFETNSSSAHALWVKSPESILFPFSEEKVITPKLVAITKKKSNDDDDGWELFNYNECEFLNFVWTAVVTKFSKRRWLLGKIDSLLKPYNIRVNWPLDALPTEEEQSFLSEKLIFYILYDLVLEILPFREIFVSIVLSDSSAVTHSERICDTDIEDTFGKREGYVRFAVQLD
ncbi:MAG: hypothetical protein LBE18_04140 [Planctomycetaceae bacterium]|jgi:hypothetical protein|nr:hypothetical protein [Planctomycetaceae bacterium]